MMGALECRIEIPEVQGLEPGKLTVGRHGILNCDGEIPPDFDFTKVRFKGENEIVVKVFKAEKIKETGLRSDFTVYKAGELSLSDYKLFDGKSELALTSPKLEVESVLKASADGQPQKPFGSIFPIPISVPNTYFLYAILAVIILITALVLKGRRLSYYRKLKQKLRKFDSPTDPETQFYKSIRAAEKKAYPISEIEEAFRLYVMRAYQLPLVDLDNARAIRYFKRNYPAHKGARMQLEKLFGDFEEIKKQNSASDLTQRHEFVKRLYNYVDHYKGLGR